MYPESVRDVFDSQIGSSIFTKETLDSFNREHKRTYRLLIIKYFISAIVYEEDEFRESQGKLNQMYMLSVSGNYEFLNEIHLGFKEEAVEYLNKQKVDILNKSDGKVSDDKIIRIVSFFKCYMKKESYLYLVNEIQDFWGIEIYYPNNNLRKHHWVDMTPCKHWQPIHTFPEFFAFQDVINLWNDTNEKYKKYKQSIEAGYSIYSRERREIDYSYSTSLRGTLVAGVHFFETYLYYLYYNFKMSKKILNNKLIKRSNVRQINDKNIIKELLEEEFPNLKSKTNSLYEIYCNMLEFRDAFVHMSAFEENGESRMQYLLKFDIIGLIEFLNNVFKYIEIIEEEVGESNQILFWKASFEWPVFELGKNISNLRV